MKASFFEVPSAKRLWVFLTLGMASLLFLFQNCAPNSSGCSDCGGDPGVHGGGNPSTFFAIHFEPRSGKAEYFETLKELINDANTYNIKLTLQFTPSWAKMILADSAKIAYLRKWQDQGHEVAAHHHGAYHGWEADGYSSLSQDDYKAARIEVHDQSSSQQQDIQETVRNSGLGESYMGDMNDFVEIFDQLIGDKTLKVMTMAPTDAAIDWLSDFIYSIDNLKMNGSKPEIVDGALVTPVSVVHNKIAVTEMSMQYINSDAQLSRAESDYNGTTSSSQIIGVVTHLDDYYYNDTYVLGWMKFVNGKDPTGASSKTVSEILDEM